MPLPTWDNLPWQIEGSNRNVFWMHCTLNARHGHVYVNRRGPDNDMYPPGYVSFIVVRCHASGYRQRIDVPAAKDHLEAYCLLIHHLEMLNAPLQGETPQAAE